MIINIGDDILKLRSLKLLNKVLINKTTNKITRGSAYAAMDRLEDERPCR